MDKMPTDYSEYKYYDYLEDDFFVSTMTFPDENSLLFWSKLIDNGMLDVDEFVSANKILESLRKGQEEIPAKRVDDLWKRIDVTRACLQGKQKRVRIFRIVTIVGTIAACVGLLVILGIAWLNPEVPEPGYVQFPADNSQNNKEIRIIAGDQQMFIEGKNAEVIYNRNGILAINSKVADTVTIHTMPMKSVYNELNVPYGKRASLTLSDGSILWVNAGTTVVYPIAFTGDKRIIQVDGEVYAEVQPDKNKPFVVKTDQLEITVLGTSFDLSAYKGDIFRRVVLVSGTVDVTSGADHTRLTPGQAYTYSSQASKVETVDVSVYTSWRNGIYIFRDEPIENILIQLARYYNVTMLLPQLPSGTLCSGKLELKEDLIKLMNDLSQIASFNFAMKNDQYKIQYSIN